MALFNSNPSKPFGESGSMVISDAQLRNPAEYRESLIYNELAQLDSAKRKAFAGSDEAKAMVEAGIISDEFIDSVKNDDVNFDKTTEITVCQLAKDAGDSQWDELLAARMHEREIMNDLIARYGERAETLGESAHQDYIVKKMPKEYRAR